MHCCRTAVVMMIVLSHCVNMWPITLWLCYANPVPLVSYCQCIRCWWAACYSHYLLPICFNVQKIWLDELQSVCCYSVLDGDYRVVELDSGGVRYLSSGRDFGLFNVSIAFHYPSSSATPLSFLVLIRRLWCQDIATLDSRSLSDLSTVVVCSVRYSYIDCPEAIP